MSVRVFRGLSALALVWGLVAPVAAQGVPQAGYLENGTSLVSFYDEDPAAPAPIPDTGAAPAPAAAADPLSAGCSTCGGGDSGACGCDLGCDTACPNWTVSAGAVFLQREAGGSVFLQTPGTTFSAPSVGFQAGGRVSLIKHRECGLDYEFAYLGFGSSAGFDFLSGNLRGAGVVPAGSQIQFATPLAIGANGILLSGLQSNVNSLEFNVRENVNEYLTLLAGFRWINLNERFSYLFTIPPLAAIVGSTQADNNLLGFQLGADGVLYDMGRFRLDGIAKAGIYGNLAQNQSALIGLPIPGPLAFQHNTTSVAFEADARLGGTYFVTDRFSVRGGYQVLWLEGVALAAKQINVSNWNTLRGVSTSGSPFYHGAYVEAGLTW
ncbi:MAG: hypothetical protein U0836_11770 [Pirellulales bacterium]